MLRSIGLKTNIMRMNIRSFHTFYDDVNDYRMYSFMLRKAVSTRNSELINVMEKSNMISSQIKKVTFKDIFYTSKYEDVDYMIHNVKDIRKNLPEYISYIEKYNTNYNKRVEQNLGRLEQEMN